MKSKDRNAGSWRFTGSLTGWEREGDNTVVLVCGEDKVQVKACAPNVVRVWLGRGGVFSRRYPSFTVQREVLSPVRLEVQETADAIALGAGAIDVRAHRDPFELSFFDGNGELLTRSAKGGALGGNDAGELSARHQMMPEEAFWGLGEKREKFNRRGTRIYNWATDLYQLDQFSPPEDEGRWYGATPFFMSSRGYAILFDNSSRTCFDFGVGEPDVWSLSSRLPAAAGELIYYIIHSPSLKGILTTFVALAGPSFFPPLYALGNGQSWWGDHWYQPDLEACAKEYRARGIPCDVMWACLEWYLGSFDPAAWNRKTFPDPAAWAKRLHENGFKVALYDEPNLPVTAPSFAAAAERGFLLADDNGKVMTVEWPWGGTSGLIDFFDPKAREWWGSLHDHTAALDVDCWWVDMNEPAKSSPEWRFHNESGGEKGALAEMHNLYALMHGRTMAEWYGKECGNRRPFFLSRSYFPGSQRYAAVWSGDTHSAFSWLQFQPRMGLSMGLSGFPLWAHDIGGYNVENPDPELFARWVEFAAFCPLHRFHHTCTFDLSNAEPSFPWSHGAEEISRASIMLRQRLLPYFYSCLADTILGTGMDAEPGAGGSGVPLMRPLFMEFPRDAATWDIDQQFLCGPSFLVAPVLERDARVKTVYFPSGDWYDYRDERVFQGPASVDYPAPLDTLPLFVRAGSIIPMSPAMLHVGEKPIDPLFLDIFPPSEGPAASFVLYEDDGLSLDYREGAFCTTSIDCAATIRNAHRSITVTIHEREQGRTGYRIEARWYRVRLHGVSAPPRSVLLNGAALAEVAAVAEMDAPVPGWSFEAKRRILTVSLPDVGHLSLLRVDAVS